MPPRYIVDTRSIKRAWRDIFLQYWKTYNHGQVRQNLATVVVFLLHTVTCANEQYVRAMAAVNILVFISRLAPLVSVMPKMAAMLAMMGRVSARYLREA
jgi:hypothetical protein